MVGTDGVASVSVVEKNPVMEGLKFVGTSALKVVGTGLGGFVFGHIYAKLAGFPADQARIAYGINGACQAAFIQLVTGVTNAFITNHAIRGFAQVTAFAASGAVGTFELHRRGLMGEKLLIITAVLQVAGVLIMLATALFAGPKEKPTYEGELEWHFKITKNFT